MAKENSHIDRVILRSGMEERLSNGSSLNRVADGGSGPMSLKEPSVLHINACLPIRLAYKPYLHFLAWLSNATARMSVLIHADRPDYRSNRIPVLDCL